MILKIKNRAILMLGGTIVILSLLFTNIIRSHESLRSIAKFFPSSQSANTTASIISQSSTLEENIPGTDSSSIINLPDYLPEPKDTDEWCIKRYSRQYLEYPNLHHAPYCEDDGSSSSLECFRTHKPDPFCIARGVHFDDSPRQEKSQKNGISLHCNLRDWTKDNRKEELQGFVSYLDFGGYFYDTGAREQLKSWEITNEQTKTVGGKKCVIDENDNKYTLLVKREGNSNIWHKLMEFWQSMITLDILRIAINPKTNKPYLSPQTEVQIILEDDAQHPFQDFWDQLTGIPAIRKSELNTTCLGNVILPLPGSSSSYWMSQYENRDCHDTFLMDAFLKRIYRYLKITPTPRKTEQTTVTIIDRKKVRKLYDIKGHMERLQRRWPDIKVQAVDFSNYTILEQVKIIRETDVLVGIIGAGLTHVFFLPEESSVAEIMSTTRLNYCGFRNVAKQRKLNYVSTHGKNATDWDATGHVGDPEELVRAKKTEEETVKNLEKNKQEQLKKEADEKKKLQEDKNQKRSEGQKKPPDRRDFYRIEDDVLYDDGFQQLANENGGKTLDKRALDWQRPEFVYLEDDEFQELVDAAINAQLNRGLRSTDVVPDSKQRLVT